MNKLSSPVDLIKKSFYIFFEKRNLIFFLSIYLLLIPFALAGSYLNSTLSNINPTDFGQLFSKFGLPLGETLIVNLVYLIISFWVGVAGIKGVADTVNNSKPSFKGTLGFAWKKLWIFSLLSIVLFLIFAGGLILLIVPGIIFGVWFYFSKFVMIDQGLGVGASMRKSKEMVKGRFWAFVGRALIFGLFISIVQIALDAIPYGVGQYISILLGAFFILPFYLLYKEFSAL